jgi:hypothetical protein
VHWSDSPCGAEPAVTSFVEKALTSGITAAATPQDGQVESGTDVEIGLEDLPTVAGEDPVVPWDDECAEGPSRKLRREGEAGTAPFVDTFLLKLRPWVVARTAAVEDRLILPGSAVPGRWDENWKLNVSTTYVYIYTYIF